MSKNLRPAIKCHGGKRYLANWIIDNFPENYEKYEYLEPYCGGASVFLNKLPSEKSETINDLDAGLVAIYRTLRDDPETFIKKLKSVTYSENVFNRELKKNEFSGLFEKAVNEFIVRRMSRGGMKKNFCWSDRERGGLPGEVNSWKTICEELSKIAERLNKTFILNKNAVDVIKSFSDVETLCYCDPPYVHDTRVSKDVYEFEMTTDDHIELANALKSFKGKVVLSGYPSTLYKNLYKGWRCVKKKVANNSSQQKTKPIKTECLWLNY